MTWPSCCRGPSVVATVQFSPAGTHHSRTDKQLGGGGGGIFRENNCTNGTKHVHKTRLLIFTTRQRHGARLTSRGAGGTGAPSPGNASWLGGDERDTPRVPPPVHPGQNPPGFTPKCSKSPRGTLTPRECVRCPCPWRSAAAQGGGGPGGGPGGGTGWVAAACRSRRVRWEKPLVQRRHWKRSARWVRMWTLRELFWVKRLQQTLHWKARTPVWVTMCFSR